jgi:hypothetical protein
LLFCKISAILNYAATGELVGGWEKTDKQEPGKMRQLKIRFLLISCYCIFHLASVAQNASVAVEKELYIVDTIEIKDPVLVFFKEGKYHYNHILVSKERLDHMRNDDSSFINYLSSGNGYLLFEAFELSHMVANLLSDNPALQHSQFYSKLQTNLRNAEKDIVFAPVDKTAQKSKEHNGWQYLEVLPGKFLLCLAKGSAIEGCRAKYMIKIQNMDNVYFKVLCPISWE